MATAPLIVIVGPTASGKTGLAIELAKRFGGEIICADSRTVYKGMDIGTAKPTHAERQGIPHWGLDLIEPSERFTAANFKRYADAKIEDIRSRGAIPFLVGGTGLYVDAVIFDYHFGNDRSMEQRAALEPLSLDELQNYCAINNIILPENSSNKRYVIRAIEQKTINNRRRVEPIDNCIIVGIATEKNELRRRIEERSEHIFADGVVEEAKRLGNLYSWECEAMTGNIYRLVKQYVDGIYTLEEIQHLFITKDWQLAKRQLTWLKRNSFIRWGTLEETNSFLDRHLQNSRKSWYSQDQESYSGDI